MLISSISLFKQEELARALRALSPREWRWLLVALILGLLGLLWLLATVDRYFAVKIATPGGQITEGIIGPPRFINPLLATSDADRDLTALIYSGLMRLDEAGLPQPDLAESVEVADDKLTYTFRLKPNLTWHDGEAITSADVEFSILAAQDPIVKSQKRAAWEGVKVEKIDERTISFKLKQNYPAFLEAATIGLLPKHIWGRLERETFALNQFNTESIGSGPYRIKNIKKDNLGIPEYYDLVPFKHFALGAPKVSLLRLRFYSSEAEWLAAYRRGEIEAGSALSAESAAALEAAGARLLRAPLPRVFGVFFNQSRAPVLANREVRQALDLAVDREKIIDQALSGYGLPATSPLPPRLKLTADTEPETENQKTATSTVNNLASTTATTLNSSNVENAQTLLKKNGWTWDEDEKRWEKKGKTATQILQFSIATANTPELKRAAELIRDAWQEAGARVELKIFELGDLNQNVIRPRQYDALFFGEILGRQPDLFAFWHSSQRLDPGLNIALYANIKADKLLAEARLESDPEKLAGLEKQFVAEIDADKPAVFVYAPEFIYLLPAKVRNVRLGAINTAADRFRNIYQWYTQTDRVWPIFVNENNKIEQ